MRDSAPIAYVLRPGDGPAIDLGGFGMSLKASAEATGGAFTLLEAAEPAGFGPPMHIHHDAAEAFYILEGEYRVFVRTGSSRVRRARSSTSPLASSTGSGSVRSPAAS